MGLPEGTADTPPLPFDYRRDYSGFGRQSGERLRTSDGRARYAPSWHSPTPGRSRRFASGCLRVQERSADFADRPQPPAASRARLVCSLCCHSRTGPSKNSLVRCFRRSEEHSEMIRWRPPLPPISGVSHLSCYKQARISDRLRRRGQGDPWFPSSSSFPYSRRLCKTLSWRHQERLNPPLTKPHFRFDPTPPSSHLPISCCSAPNLIDRVHQSRL